MPVIHFHYCVHKNSGEIRRIRNINKYVAGRLSDSVIELEFYPLKFFSFVKNEKNKFLLSNNVKKKYYWPIINKIRWVSQYYSSLMVGLLCWKYKPEYIIGEFGSSSRSMHFVKFFSPNTKTIIDVHGASPEEYIYSHRESAKKSVVDRLTYNERYMSDSIDYIICQSDEMKRHLINKYGTNHKKIASYKCGVDVGMFKIDDEVRHNVRDMLGATDNDIVFVYSGGMMKWQKIEESLAIYKEFHLCFPDSIFLILTRDTDMLNEILASASFQSLSDSIIVKSVRMEEVPDFLNAADIAFLIRDNDIMNTVASPTKLAEYMACGLPIITSEVSKYWVTEDAEKFLIKAETQENLNHKIINMLAMVDKKNIREWACANLSVENDVKNINRLFKLL